MKKDILKEINTLPDDFLTALRDVSQLTQTRVYLSGGVLRDWLLGVSAVDFDFTVSENGLEFGRRLAETLHATFVRLADDEGICRVVWKGLVIDISTFRKKAQCIEDDLYCRDFTINAMAVEILSDGAGGVVCGPVIDPLGGMDDLQEKALRVCSSDCLEDDPLRLLRAFRFMAQLGFSIDRQSTQLITKFSKNIVRVAGERIWAELKKIFLQSKSSEVLMAMESVGLLQEVFPELAAGRGVKQPASHHLDVLDHCLETLKKIELVIENPGKWFTETVDLIQKYCTDQNTLLYLKVAALLHDIGKPPVGNLQESGKITFYNHDGQGEVIVAAIARRLKWSSVELARISRFVKQHMWPFHLNNARKKTGIKPRACLKIAKAAGEDLVGLFLLAMADSLAGEGEGKPAGMEREVASLFSEVYSTYVLRVKPVLDRLPINGHDLIKYLHLQPGPIFGEIFSELEQEMVLSGKMSKGQALDWVKNFLTLQKTELAQPDTRNSII